MPPLLERALFGLARATPCCSVHAQKRVQAARGAMAEGARVGLHAGGLRAREGCAGDRSECCRCGQRGGGGGEDAHAVAVGPRVDCHIIAALEDPERPLFFARESRSLTAGQWQRRRRPTGCKCSSGDAATAAGAAAPPSLYHCLSWHCLTSLCVTKAFICLRSQDRLRLVVEWACCSVRRGDAPNPGPARAVLTGRRAGSGSAQGGPWRIAGTARAQTHCIIPAQQVLAV